MGYVEEDAKNIVKEVGEMFTGPRLRVRRCDLTDLDLEFIVALSDKRPFGVCVFCGGEVANSYGYFAETETIVVAYKRVRGNALSLAIKVGRTPAKKDTNHLLKLTGIPRKSPWGQLYFEHKGRGGKLQDIGGKRFILHLEEKGGDSDE